METVKSMKNFSSIFSIIIFCAVLYALSSYFIKEEVDSTINYYASFEGKNLQDLQNFEGLEESLESIQLTLVDVNIVQGSEGNKSWELKAEWAKYVESTSNLLAQKPFITFWDDENKNSLPITIEGKVGKVLENNTRITLNEDVKISQDTMALEGKLLEVLVEESRFIFPDGALLSSPTNLGRANTMTWNSKINTIDATGDVVFIINNDNKSFTLDSPIKAPPVIEE